jgi:hypothetical protein
VLNRINDYDPNLFRFITDPDSYLKTYLRAHNQDAYNLIYNPLGWLVNMGYKVSHDLGDMFSDPKGYISRLVPGLPGELQGLITDPTGTVTTWLLAEIETKVSKYQDRLYNLGERVIRLFFEGIF